MSRRDADRGGESWHVTPVDDLREHETDGAPCWCRPKTTPEGVVVYNSLDGRERFETGERRPS